MKKDKLYVLGDSIARGVLFDDKTNTYTLCRNTFDTLLRSTGVKVFNYSKMGMTSSDALHMIQKCPSDENAVAAIEFGGNDSDLNWDAVAASPDIYHEAAVSIETYEENIKRLVSEVRSLGMHPVIVTPLPLSADKFFRFITQNRDKNAVMAYLKSEQSIYRWQERYALAAIRASHDASCPLLDLRSLFLNHLDFDALIGPDGMHPTEKGYQIISQAVLNAWQNGITQYRISIVS